MITINGLNKAGFIWYTVPKIPDFIWYTVPKIVASAGDWKNLEALFLDWEAKVAAAEKVAQLSGLG